MDQEPQSLVSQELQKVLLSSDFSTLASPITAQNDNKQSNASASLLQDDIIELDEQSFDRWVPLLRTSIEDSSLTKLVEELFNSVDDNFQSLETRILQDSQINDNLTTSINEIESIQTLINGSLQQEVSDLQQQLSQSTNDVILKKQIFINNRKTSMKISESMILINKILQILELSNRCQDLIKEGDFFKALQSLDNLEKIYLQDFKNYNFDFLKEIYDSIPFLKSIIKDESINLIKKSFTSNLEKTLFTVGSKYFEVYQEVLLKDWLELKHSMKLGNFKFNSSVELALRDQKSLELLKAENFYHLDEFHDSILIFQNLKELDYLCEEFIKEYDFRKAKLVYPLELKNTTTSSSLNGQHQSHLDDVFGENLSMSFLKEYLLKILGFLIYDKHLNKSTDYVLSFNSYNTTNEFWDILMKKLAPHLQQFVTRNLTTEEELVQFKDFLGIFIAILENLKLNIETLYRIHITVFEKYCNLLVHKFSEEFSTLLNDDDFMPLTTNDRNLYEKVLKICWLKEEEPEKMKEQQDPANGDFLATLPFSPLYPMACTLAKKTYGKMVTFLNNFYQHELYHLNTILVKTMDSIFQKVVNNKIRSKLDTTSREEIAQVLINLDYFVIAAREFSSILTRENIIQNPDVEIRLASAEQLTESRKYAETKLIELIDSKVSDLMEFVELDWVATTIKQEPDISIRDIAQFLEMMFTSTLVNLPYSVKTLLIFREFDSLTRRFLEMLLNGTPSTITPQSVLNFEMDMKFLEGIISKIFPSETKELPFESSPSPDSPLQSDQARASNLIENNVRSLQSTFTDLKQHIQLMKANNLEEYKDPSIRMRKYPRIRPEVAQLLVTKVAIPSPSPSAGDGDNTSYRGQSPTESLTANSRIAKFFNRG